MAGRSLSKVEALVQDLHAEDSFGVVVADMTDLASLDAMAASTRYTMHSPVPCPCVLVVTHVLRVHFFGPSRP